MTFDLKSIDLKKIDFKDKKTQTVILIVLAVIFVFSVYLFFVFLPSAGNDIRSVGKILKTRGDLKSARLLIAEKGTLKKKAAEYGDKIELYEKKLPAQQEIPTLLEELSKMARNSDISIIGITPAALKPQKDTKAQVYRETPILITAKSGYHELGRFLSNLENGDRFMKIVDIGIKTNSASPKKHDVELMVYTYVLPSE